MTFSGLTQLNVTTAGPAILASGELVSGNYFETLGTQAIVGGLLTGLVSGFALIALALSGLGIYGTLAFFVARRTSEIGVHMALGARQRAVVALVMRQTALPVLIGLASGIVGALLSGGAVESLLFGLEPQSPWALAGAAAVLLACSVCASIAPALRAAGIAPIEALRYE